MAVKDYVLEPIIHEPCAEHPDGFCFHYVALGLLGELSMELVDRLQDHPHRHAQEIVEVVPGFIGDLLPVFPYPIRECLVERFALDPQNYPDVKLRKRYHIDDQLDPAPDGATVSVGIMATFYTLLTDIEADPEQVQYLPPEYRAPLKLLTDYFHAALGPYAELGSDGWVSDDEAEAGE